MSLSGFIKFSVEAELISQREFISNHNVTNQNNTVNNNISNYGEIKSEKNFGILNKAQTAKNPLKSKTQRSCSFDSENQQKDKSINNNSINQGNLNSFSVRNTNNANTEIFGGNKLFKNDVSMIFYYLCGMQNFDVSKKIRNHFDKNSGYNPHFENSQKGPSLDSKNLLKADKDVKPLKMNFVLFLKSFELIANRIYKDYSEAQALEMLFDMNLIGLLKNKIEGNSLKKNYLDILNNLRRDDIVIILFIY